mmetsp:Transcript_9291/g.21972  ORF Transcript_9291/g.21972 Transcript_9291/m.21972 type:complete len:239 (+) Transcript_9291:300-1016(+)
MWLVRSRSMTRPRWATFGSSSTWRWTTRTSPSHTGSVSRGRRARVRRRASGWQRRAFRWSCCTLAPSPSTGGTTAPTPTPSSTRTIGRRAADGTVTAAAAASAGGTTTSATSTSTSMTMARKSRSALAIPRAVVPRASGAGAASGRSGRAGQAGRSARRGAGTRRRRRRRRKRSTIARGRRRRRRRRPRSSHSPSSSVPRSPSRGRPPRSRWCRIRCLPSSRSSRAALTCGASSRSAA